MRRRRDLAVVGAALIAAGVAGCGSTSHSASPAADRAAVRGALVQLDEATAAHNYQMLCNRVLARELVQKVASAGLPCEEALRIGLGKVRQPHLQVTEIKVQGNRALAQVYSGATGQRSSTDIVQLVREQGGWRVTALAAPEPPAPRSATAEP
jgi:Putative lumazine-binding